MKYIKFEMSLSNMSSNFHNNYHRESGTMNKSDTIATREGYKKEIDFIGTYHYCFHKGLQGSNFNRDSLAHVVSDPGNAWNPWPVR